MEQGNRLAVGNIVQVEARTWPGINKPGGVGRIIQLNYSQNGNEVTSVDVRYTVVGGRERNVPIEHLQAAPQFDASQHKNQLRDRSGLLGRCKRCGSLRADCGSCDWLEQERLAKNPSEQESNETSRRKSTKSKGRKQKIQIPDDSSSSSEDEEQIRADNNRRRRYRRQKAYWLTAFDDSASDSQDDQSQQEEEAPFSDSDDSLLARIADLERRRRDEKKRHLAKKYSKLARKKTKHTRRRLQSTTLSTLEALNEAPRASVREESPNTETNLRGKGGSHSPAMPRHTHQQVEAEDIDVSSEDMLPPPSLGEPEEGEIHAEEDIQSQVVNSADNNTLDLEGLGFIQPEGEAAAKNLPSDIVDRTQSIPYQQLPSFFDELLDELAYDIIPEGGVQIENFALETRRVRNRNDLEALHRHKENGLKLYDEIQRQVIKDGIDQCREAMRRMTDSHQRRRHKKQMTKEEQKQFRSVALEARDAQMDVVVPQAEGLLRKANSLLLRVFGVADEFGVEDEEVSDSSGQSSDVSTSVLTQDLVSTNASQSDMRFEGDESSSLPPFDPHMHATTVRRNSRTKRSWRRSIATNRSRRKRKKQQNVDVNGNVVGDDTTMADLQSDRRSSRKRRRERREPLSRSRESDHSNASDVSSESNNGGSISFETSDEPRAPRQRRRGARSQTGVSRQQIGEAFMTAMNKGVDRAPVADRMQAFLDANSSNIDDFGGFSNLPDGNVGKTDGDQRRRHRNRQTQHQRGCEPSLLRGASAYQEDVSASLEADDSPIDQDEEVESCQPTTVLSDVLYKRLARKQRSPAQMREPLVRPTTSISESCRTLLATFGDSVDDCAGVFDSIVLHFRQQSIIVRSEAATVLDVLLQLLQRRGSKTLQAVVLTEANMIRRHVRLLKFAFDLLDCKVNAAIVSDDGLAFKIFGRDNWKTFVENIVLQMMDAIYARVQPASWGLDGAICSEIIETLVPLRDAAARLVPLVEMVSMCTLEKFQCQRWCELGDSSEVFVTAVDPQEYKSLVLTGSTSSSVSNEGSVRFQCFKKAIPRFEIEVLWLLLAFFAESGCVLSGGSKYRWRLIASLFGSSAGVLSKEYFESINKEEMKLPPEKGHVVRCREELIRFGSLLSSTALNPLPDSDNFLTKMIQKCLLLQAHEYRYSFDQNGRVVFCDLDEADRRRISEAWKTTDLHGERTALPVALQDLDDSEIPGGLREQSTGRMSGLFSLSPLLQSCVNLLTLWIRQVPKKKARRSRLRQALNKIVEDCIDNASKLEASNEHATSASTFEQAFAVPMTNFGSHHAASVYRDAAARLSVIGAVDGSDGTNCSLTKELRERIWDVLSSQEMKKRQRFLISPEGSSTGADMYGGDPFPLFSAAKAMAWLVDLHFLPTDSSTAGVDDDKTMLSFLASSLATCLDCACDLFEAQTNLSVSRVNEEAALHFDNIASIVSCICLWLSQLCIRSQIFINASVVIPEAPLLRLRTAAQELRSTLFGMLASPLKKCLLRLTNSAFHCENADLALLSVLGLVRAVVGLTATNIDEHRANPEEPESAFSSRPPMEQSSDEDLFGSMDDELFLNIDLGINSREGQNSEGGRSSGENDKDIEAFKEIWVTLIDMIKLTRPSERFAILPPTESRTSEVACMSIPGRTIAANNIGEACACLAALTSLDKQDTTIVNSSLEVFASSTKFQSWTALDDADQRYFRSMGQCFYSELCGLSDDFEQCRRLVENRFDTIVEYFVGAMLDSNTLERFPSMNLRRIKVNSGVRGEEKQRYRIKLANSSRHSTESGRELLNEAGARLGRSEKVNSPGPAYNSSHLWSFCDSLGKVVGRNGGSLFSELDSDPTDRSGDSIRLVSLEKECMRRMKFFRGVLSNSAKDFSNQGALNFESLSNLIISSCCYELASISKGVHYQTRFGRNNSSGDRKTYKHARLLELQSCYAELTVGLMSWILRVRPRPSEAFERMLQCVRDQLCSQLLLKKTCDVHRSLQNIYSLATSGTVSSGITVAETDESGVANDIFVAIVRRSREIMLHIALDQRHNGMRNVYCLLNAFITLGTNYSKDEEHFLDLITKSLDDDNRNSPTAISRLLPDTSPFEKALDQYLNHVARDQDIGNCIESTALHELRHILIRQFLVPKLLKNSVSLLQKKGILHFLSRILQIESEKSTELEVQLVAAIAKGIASCLRLSLASHVVDDELVRVVFQCTKHVLTFPFLSHDTESGGGRQEDSVLNWSRRCKDRVVVEAKPPFALYLWTFATWMNHVGTLIVQRTEQDKQAFQDFRSKAVSLAVEGKSIWNENACNIMAIVQDSSRLVSLEASVFVEKENTQPVTNVYAKTRSKSQEDAVLQGNESGDWRPSSSVCRSAKELEANFISCL